MWGQSNLAGYLDLVDENTEGVGDADDIRKFVRALEAEMKKGAEFGYNILVCCGKKGAAIESYHTGSLSLEKSFTKQYRTNDLSKVVVPSSPRHVTNVGTLVPNGKRQNCNSTDSTLCARLQCILFRANRVYRSL